MNGVLPWGAEFPDRRTLQFKVVNFDSARGEFSGYAAYFDNEDLVGDVIEKGAFSRTLRDAQERQRATGSRFLYPLLFMHEAKWPVGGILAAREDSRGLKIDGWLDLSNSQAKDVFSAMSAGYVDSFSIGYNVKRSNRDSKGVRHLTDVDLTEISCITSGFAANPSARLDMASVKSTTKADRSIAAIDERMRRLARNVGSDADTSWQRQRLPLTGNPAPAFSGTRDPGPPQPSRSAYVSDHLWQEAVDDWVAKLRGDDAFRTARERDERQFHDAVRKQRDERVKTGRASLAECEQFYQQYGVTGDGRTLLCDDAAFDRAVRAMQERLATADSGGE